MNSLMKKKLMHIKSFDDVDFSKDLIKILDQGYFLYKNIFILNYFYRDEYLDRKDEVFKNLIKFQMDETGVEASKNSFHVDYYCNSDYLENAINFCFIAGESIKDVNDLVFGITFSDIDDVVIKIYRYRPGQRYLLNNIEGYDQPILHFMQAEIEKLRVELNYVEASNL